MPAYVLTLIAPPDPQILTQALAREVAALVQATRVEWLAPSQALDLFFEQAPESILPKVRDFCYPFPIDIALQPVDHRRKSLLIADMDSTIIEQECLDELADYVGMKDQVAAITEQAMRGEIAFEPALRTRVALLKGLSEQVIGRVINERISLMSGARQLVMTMRQNGAKTMLVSGGFTPFARWVSEQVGFQSYQANVLEVEDGQFTGMVREPILGRDAKRVALEQACGELGFAPEHAIAVGDGANDLAMLQLAGMGVAYHARPAVAEAAHVAIRHNDLTALLYVQGYKLEEFVTQEGSFTQEAY